MGFRDVDGGVRYYEFDLLAGVGVVQAVFTRRGGASPEPWAGLNVGGTVGDDPQRVAENRQRAFWAVDRNPDSLYDVWQVHGREVVRADAPRPLHTPHRKADAILTDRPEVSLFMRFADCTPVLLVDPVQRVVGLAHAGWKGTVQRVAAAAVEAMGAAYGTRPENVLAAIGPSIGAHHYPVGPEVVAEARAAFGADASGLLETHNGSTHFDLWAANRLALEGAGVREIEVAGLCTACGLDDWYSHRAEAGRTGRFGALIALQG
jgi:YfiH family protein